MISWPGSGGAARGRRGGPPRPGGGGGRGGAEPLLHEGHLPEELAGTHVPDAVAVARHLDASLRDEEEAHARIALLHDDRTGVVGAFLHRPGDELQFPRGQPAEDGHPAEIVEIGCGVGHALPPRAAWGLRLMFDSAWISPPATESGAGTAASAGGISGDAADGIGRGGGGGGGGDPGGGRGRG